MQSGSVGARFGVGVTELLRREFGYWDERSARSTDRHFGKPGLVLNYLPS